MQKNQHIQITVLTLLVVLLVLIAADLFYFSIDLTEAKIHTLSQDSIDVISENLSGELLLTYYRTDKLLQFSAFPHQIEDVLRKYENTIKGVRVRIEDPTGNEEYMSRIGLKARQMELPSYDEINYLVGFSGIHISYKGKTAVIPYLENVYQLEYKLTSAIQRMLTGDAIKIGYYIYGEGRTYQETYQGFLYALEDVGVPFPLIPGDEIPSDIDVLIVSSSVVFTEDDIKKIDAYVSEGGSTLFFVDGVTVSLHDNFKIMPHKSSRLLTLLKHYGIYPQDVLIGDLLAKQLPANQDVNGSSFQQLKDYYYWPLIHPDAVNSEHPISSHFSGLELYWPSPLVLEKQADILFTTTEQSWAKLAFGDIRPESVFFEKADNVNYILGAAYDGMLESYYNKTQHASTHSTEAEKTSRIVVVGDSDFVSDLHLFDHGDYNRVFLKNAVEWAANEERMINIRSKTVKDVRLNAIPSEKVAEVFELNAWFMTIVLPAIIAIVGLIHFRSRKKRVQGKEV